MNGNDLAFPLSLSIEEFNAGLTKRELFAAMALQGLLANTVVARSSQDAVAIAVLAADELIKELDNKQTVKNNIVLSVPCTCGECALEHFICGTCNRTVPNCFGAADEYLNDCDDCVAEKGAKNES